MTVRVAFDEGHTDVTEWAPGEREAGSAHIERPLPKRLSNYKVRAGEELLVFPNGDFTQAHQIQLESLILAQNER